jgi:hypothetical protein
MEEIIGSITNGAVFKPQSPTADLARFQMRESEKECVAVTKAVLRAEPPSPRYFTKFASNGSFVQNCASSYFS